jgi:hypothetical protein
MMSFAIAPVTIMVTLGLMGCSSSQFGSSKNTTATSRNAADGTAASSQATASTSGQSTPGANGASTDASSAGPSNSSTDTKDGGNALPNSTGGGQGLDDDSSPCSLKGPANAAKFKITGNHPVENLSLTGSSDIFIRGNTSSVTADTQTLPIYTTIDFVSINIAGNAGQMTLNLANSTKIKELCIWSRGNIPATTINVGAGSSIGAVTIDANGNKSTVTIQGSDKDDCSNVLDGNGRATVTCVPKH